MKITCSLGVRGSLLTGLRINSNIIRNSTTKGIIAAVVALVVILIVAGLTWWVLVKTKNIELKQRKPQSQLLAEKWQEYNKARIRKN